MQLFVARAIDGLSNGATYAAIALALVLIFKATTLINFAQGELAALGAFVTYVFAVQKASLPLWLALIIGMTLTALIAAGTERVLIRPFDPSDHLPLVIVTLGLFLIVNSLMGVIWRFDPRGFPTLFPTGNAWSWGTTQLRWHDIGVMSTVLVTVAVLHLLLNRTRIGLAFRAVSSNLESSQLVGIRIGRTLQFGWALAAAIGTLAAVLFVSSPVRQLEPTIMLRVLIFASAAAALGGLDSIWGALAGGISVGLLQSFFGYVPEWTDNLIGNDLSLAMAFVVLLVVLVLRPAGLFGTRGRAGMSPRWTLLEGTAAHRRYQAVAWTVAILSIVLVGFLFAETWDPTLFGDKYTIGLDNVSHAVSLMVAVLGLNFLVGFSGQVSLGHSFFIGVGAYTSGVLMENYGWPFAATFFVVIPACFVFGMIVGIPALRIRGLYLALVTLVLAVIFPTLVRLDAVDEYTGGSNSLVVSADYDPPGWAPLNGIAEALQAIPLVGGAFGSDGLSSRQEERVWRYLIVVVIAAVCVWMAANMIRSRAGRAIIAIRDNETGAAVTGVNLPLYKTLAFGISAAFAGVSGVMYTIAVGALAPDSFGIELAIFLIVGLVVGGVATHSGAIVGGLAIIFIPEWSRQWATQTDSALGFEVTGDKPFGTLLLGVLLIVITFVMPGGVMGAIRKLRGRVVQVLPATPGPGGEERPGAPGTIRQRTQGPTIAHATVEETT